MKIYLVGGAVRDQLLGKTPKDKDYVVVGSSIEEMLFLGYEKVGKHFPVFLHPESRDEYALARKEKKTAKGHQGFEFVWDGVTLEEDLFRRDFTVNAMAQDLETGEIIDPFGGQEDIRNNILKHVSDHFVEDPLRVVRGARFLAQTPLTLHSETKELWERMVQEGELQTLSVERIWNEMHKALLGNNPTKFFESLLETGALDVLMPELARLKGVPQPEKYHPEGCCWTHTMLVLKNACKLSPKIEPRFAALVHDLGKGVTPKEELPKHHNHEVNGVPLVEEVCDRFKVPNSVRKVSLLATRLYLRVHRSRELKPGKLLTLLKDLRHDSNCSTFEDVLAVCEADNLGKQADNYIEADFLRYVAVGLKRTDLSEIIDKYKGTSKIPEMINQFQIKTVKKLANQFVY